MHDKIEDLVRSELLKKRDEGRGKPVSRAVALPMMPKTLEIASLMEEQEKLAMPDVPELAEFAWQLYRLEASNVVGKRISDARSDPKVFKALAPIVSALSKLSKIADAETGPNAHARSVFLNNLAVYDENGDYISNTWFLEVAKKLHLALQSEYGRLEDQSSLEDKSDETPDAGPAKKPRQDLLGRHLPNLYFDLYPEGAIGGNNRYDERSGPLYRFVELAARAIGIEDVNAGQIHTARQRIKKVGKSPK